jgi:ISXO2-like transposase domain/Transposase zinc-ribbon domain
MADFPRSLSEFEQWFGDEAACAEYLAGARWPDGFVCPGCGGNKAWRLETKPWVHECADCGRQTSVTAGTIMHKSKLPLTSWFWSAYAMATQPMGISALQLQRELRISSYKTAWFLSARLRSTMAASGSGALSGLVEIGQSEIPYRRKRITAAGASGRSRAGKISVIGAVEIHELRPGRIRLSTLPDCSPESLHAFLAANLTPGVTVKTNEGFLYRGAPAVSNDRISHVIDTPWIRRIFSEFEAWALGAYHGLHPEHLQSYLDEFAFRFNTRRDRHAAFRYLIGIATAHQPLTCNMLVHGEKRHNRQGALQR